MPVFGWALFQDHGTDTTWRIVAFVVFAVASATDRLDGDLARRRGLVTDVGKMADPIADKALTGTALVGLSALDLLPWWVTVVILARELGITLLRFWVIRHGVIPASRGGKYKTFLQTVAIGLYLLPLHGLAGHRRGLGDGRGAGSHRGDRHRLRRPGAGAAPGRADAVVIAPGTPAADGAGPPPATAERLLDALVAVGATVAVAESLTGGLLTAALTEPAGASAAVRGGLVVYATDLKATLAGVPVPLLPRRAGQPGRRRRARGRRPGPPRRHVRAGRDRGRRPRPAGRLPGRHRVRRARRPGLRHRPAPHALG